MNWLRINRVCALVIALILIGIAVRGFAGFSQSAAYDAFHLIFGVIGLLSVIVAAGRYSPAFNLVFGLIDAYQAIAQPLGLFPTQLFNLSASDTAQHVIVAVVLIGVSATYFLRAGKRPASALDARRTR